MKNKRIIKAGLLLMLGFLSCKKGGLETYDDEKSKNSIYFPLTQKFSGIDVSFGYSKADVKDSTVSILVQIIGAAKSIDRPYQLSIADTSTLVQGQDYILETKPQIDAGKVSDTLKIKFLRTPGIAIKAKYLYLDLKPNDHFTNNYLSQGVLVGGDVKTTFFTRLTIKLDDIAGPPPFWSPNSSSYAYTTGYFGTFSSLKYQLLINRYNLDVFELNKPTWFSANSRKIIAWASGMKAYLTQMQLSGQTIYEADGVTPMTMGPSAK